MQKYRYNIIILLYNNSYLSIFLFDYSYIKLASNKYSEHL